MPGTDIPFETLVAFVSGELGPDASDAVRRRLAGSPRAAADVAGLREVVETMRADEEPSPDVLERVIGQVVGAIRREPNRFPESRVPGNRVAENLAEIGAMVAHLVFDSRRPPAMAGLRGDGGAYQLAYESDLGRVDLQVTCGPVASGQELSDERRVRGQLVPRGRALPATVRLVSADDGATACVCATDARGRFKLSSSVGTYDAIVGFPEQPDALVLPGLALD